MEQPAVPAVEHQGHQAINSLEQDLLTHPFYLNREEYEKGAYHEREYPHYVNQYNNRRERVEKQKHTQDRRQETIDQ